MGAAVDARRWVATHQRTLGVIGGIACLGLAVVWLVVVPDEASGATGLREALLRYGHSVVWLLLGLSALLFATGGPRRSVEWTATAALAVYIAFVVALVM